jgi:hypothetical protein
MRVALSSLLLVALAALPARADLSVLCGTSATVMRLAAADSTVSFEQRAVAIAFGITSPGDLANEYRSRAAAALPVPPGQGLDGSIPAGPAEGADSESVLISLPDAPGGDILCLSGLLSLGALHTLRRARQAHFGVLPSWYHTERLDQVGHAVPFEFDFETLPACLFETPAPPTHVRFAQCAESEFVRILYVYHSSTLARPPPLGLPNDVSVAL